MKLKYTGKIKRHQRIGSFNIPKRYKRNAISADLHRGERILSNFDTKVQIIESKFKSVGYPLPFIDNVVGTFKEKNIVDYNNITDDNDDKCLYHHISFKLINVSFC